jgi:hypothetical protein
MLNENEVQLISLMVGCLNRIIVEKLVIKAREAYKSNSYLDQVQAPSELMDKFCQDMEIDALKDKKIVKFLNTPNENLLEMKAGKAVKLTLDQIAILAIKLNGWIEVEMESVEIVDEDNVLGSTILSLTLRELRMLCSDKINSLLPNLPPDLMPLLCPNQLEKLDTKHLSQEQVNVLFQEPTNPVLKMKLRHVVDIFSQFQIENMLDRLPEYVLSYLNEKQTQAPAVSPPPNDLTPSEELEGKAADKMEEVPDIPEDIETGVITKDNLSEEKTKASWDICQIS